MATIEYQRICKKINILLGPSKRYNRTVDKIKYKKQKGILNSNFNKIIKEDFKEILLGFIDILEEPTLINTPNYRKILAYTENDYLKLFSSYGYELGSWLTKDSKLTPENNRSFFNFPLFFKESCRKCNIPRYANMDLDKLDYMLSNFIDLKHTKSLEPRKDRDVIEDEVRVLMHVKSPEKNEYNTEAEYSSAGKLARMNRDSKILFVTKDYGSGYGFDLLGTIDGIENLVTVKACDDNESFLLSKKEYDEMVKASKLPHTRYYIHKYLYDKNKANLFRHECLLFTSYVYDPDNEVLMDISDEENICNIERKEFITKNGVKKVRYVCTPVKFKYTKENKTLKKVYNGEEGSK